MTDEHPPTDHIFRGRALMCRRGAAARSRVIENGVVQNPDLRPDFPVGQCVVHASHGLGKIVASRGTGDARTVDIDFERFGRKTFQLCFARRHLRPEDAPPPAETR